MTDKQGLHVREALWPEDAAALEHLRTTVFVKEQGVSRDIEWDGQDADAKHVIAEQAGQAVGCGRLLADGRIGRLAVLPAFRGQGIGDRLLQQILQIARQRGEQTLYLHAQADAAPFYRRAGFTPRGEPFHEADILHIDMHIKLSYCDWNAPIAPLRYPHPFNELVIAQATLARRELRILSPQLDTRVFDQEDLAAAIRIFLRGGRHSQVRILVRDARALVQRGHRLLALARRLPSRIELRALPEHPQWNEETRVIRDRDSVLELPGGDAGAGFYHPEDRPRGAAAVGHFEELWQIGQVDPEFRALAI